MNTIKIIGGPRENSARYSSRSGDEVEITPLPTESEGAFCERVTAMAEAAGASLLIFGGPPKRRLERANA